MRHIFTFASDIFFGPKRFEIFSIIEIKRLFLVVVNLKAKLFNSVINMLAKCIDA